MKKTIFVFGSLIVAFLALFQLSKYSVLSGNLRIEIIITGIAILFFALGVYLHKKSLQNKTPISPSAEIDRQTIETLGLSKREYEILVKISEGCSNKEIGNALFVSESTVKSHVSNLFTKLNVKRRTQAINRAKQLKIIQ